MMSSTAGEEGDGDPLQNNKVPVNILQESAKWSTAFQANSALANFDADCLLHIFSKLSLSEIYKVGLTCRRLFYYFKQSCRPRHKSLVLLKGNKKEIEMYNADFGEVTAIVDMTEEGNEITKQMDPILIQIVLPDNLDFCSEKSFQKLMSLTFTQHLFDIFPNLTSLQLAANFRNVDFGRLIYQLNNNLPQLTTLQLAPHFEKGCFPCAIKTRKLWRSLGQLKPPALKHLTLCLNGLAFALSGKNAKEEMPSLSFLSQLEFFNILYNEATTFPSIYPLIRQVYGLSHLVPGRDATFGVSFSYKNAKNLWQEEAELLPYITYLNVNINFHYKSTFDHGDFYYCENDQHLKKRKLYERSISSLFCHFSQLSNLVEVKLKLGEGNACADYPALLAALSGLQHLKAISFDFSRNVKVINGCKWNRSDLRILPTVRTFFIKYYSKNHADVVGQFHLPFVFPRLTNFECIFEQKSCNICEYSANFSAGLYLLNYLHCGAHLTRGLEQFPVEVKRQKMFHFNEFSGSFEDLQRAAYHYFLENLNEVENYYVSEDDNDPEDEEVAQYWESRDWDPDF